MDKGAHQVFVNISFYAKISCYYNCMRKLVCCHAELLCYYSIMLTLLPCMSFVNMQGLTMLSYRISFVYVNGGPNAT